MPYIVLMGNRSRDGHMQCTAYAVCHVRDTLICGMSRTRYAAYVVRIVCGILRLRYAAYAVCCVCGTLRMRYATYAVRIVRDTLRMRYSAYARYDTVHMPGTLRMRYAASVVCCV